MWQQYIRTPCARAAYGLSKALRPWKLPSITLAQLKRIAVCARCWRLSLPRVRWLLVGALWLAGIVAGLTLLASYESAAGAAGQVPRNWPTGSQIPLGEHGQTLVMFAHPRCPCTRASLEELAKIVARTPDGVTAWVVFFKPANMPPSWHETDQWFTAAEMPGAHALCDIDGSEACLFQALTSGHTVLYNSSGELLFSGGITMARGHVGDNIGRGDIESLLIGSTSAHAQTPVYGCPIVVPPEQE